MKAAWVAFFVGSLTACLAQDVPRSDGRSPKIGDSGYRTQRDVPYAQMAGVRPKFLSLDIYSPLPPIPGGAPVVIMVHGGGWRAGDKSTAASGREKAAFFTSKGYVYVSVNYRLAPAVRHPVPAEDVARAVTWVARHIRTHGGDPARISLMGHSAGAHLAALVATDERYLGASGQTPSLLLGVVLLDTAAYDIARHMTPSAARRFNRALYERAFGTDPAVWADASPLRHVKPGKSLPRFLIFHTDRRPAGSGARDFAAALRKTGTPVGVVRARGKTHATLHHAIGKPGDGPSQLILDFLSGVNSFPDSI
jgi:arylformamidase